MIENMYTVLSREECEVIHRATLQIFENPGIMVSDAEARQIFADGGCEVNEKTKMVKIPEHILKDVLRTAPSRFTAHARDPNHTLDISNKGKVHYSNFGVGVKMTEYQGAGKYVHRGSTEEDVINLAKILVG